MGRFCWLCLLGLIAASSIVTSSAALEWSVERNFRYFVYPSDNAVQTIAADILYDQQGHLPNPEDLEHLLNGPDFWSTPLANAGDRRVSWPISWQNPQHKTVADLISALRAQEARAGAPSEIETSRLGWASLMAHGNNPGRTMGSTDTCWDPAVRLHTNCRQYGDYVRPLGWIVRIYDPQAQGQCS
jgi:hypothetical protein